MLKEIKKEIKTELEELKQKVKTESEELKQEMNIRYNFLLMLWLASTAIISGLSLFSLLVGVD